MPKDAQSPRSYDIAVIGAGPTGLTAALAFARLDFRTLLLAPGINLKDGRTTALMQQSGDFLSTLGVWQEIALKASPLVRMRMVDATGRLIRAPEVTFDSAELDLEAFGYNIANKDLNAVLADAVAADPNITFVEQAADMYQFGASSVGVTDASGETHLAHLVVAADGRASPLRAAAGIETNTWSYPQVALVLNLEHDRPHDDTSTEFHTPTGPFTLVPLPGRKSSLVCVESAEGADTLFAMTDETLALELERRAHSILGKFKIIGKKQKYPLSGLTAKSVARDRVALVGETAHVFPPIGAQGLNLGLRDVAALVRVVSAARARSSDIGGPETMQLYEIDRRTDIRTRTTAVDLLNRSLLNGFLPIQVARSAGMYLAGRVGPLRRFLMRQGIAPGTTGPRKRARARQGAA